MIKDFYLVWSDGAGVPTVKHPTVEEAITEAKRLARYSPGLKFHVLGLIGTAVKADVVFTYTNGEDIPF